MTSNANHKIRVSTIKPGDRGRVTNKEVTWAKLCEKLARAQRDEQHTHAQYLALGVDDKNKAKDVGSYVLGQFEGNKRKRGNLKSRSGVALDIDTVTLDQMEHFSLGLSELFDYEFFATTTRSHTTMAPKWRIVFPSAKLIPAENFPAVSRILSSKLFDDVQESMDAVDDVTHRIVQIMYWPSVSSDQPFKTFANHGKLLDHEALLAAYDGWEDWSKLPYSEKRGLKRPGQVAPAERPIEKKGLVGAFCRAYTVPEAMEKFIPGVYVDPKKEGRDLRYTYAAGHGSKGAIVYDDGQFLYSHHGTDPCGERNVNAFDMVRLHLYGGEDSKDDELTPSQQPSYKALEELLKDDQDVKVATLAMRYDTTRMFGDLDDPEPARTEVALLGPTGALSPSLIEPEDNDDLLGPSPAPLDTYADHDDLLGSAPAVIAASAVVPARPGHDPILGDDEDGIDPILGTPVTDWMSTLDIGEKGEIKSNVANLAIILKNDPRIKGAIAHNEFSDEIVLRRPMALNHATSVRIRISDLLNGDHWQDQHDASLRIILEAARGTGQVGYAMKISQRDLKDAVENVARENGFNPVKEIWEAVKWDGVTRLDRLFIDYLGAAENEYHREIAVKMLVALVARVYEPGHKFDYMAILEGMQGIRKSTFLRILSMGFFAEMSADFEDTKKAVETMRGALIIEMGELTQFNRAEVTAIKQFVSSDFDKVRMAYARHETVFKRRSVFFGSTNEDTYLRDSTGNRRFWPVKTDLAPGQEIDTEALEKAVPQLYAEALVYYRRLRAEQPNGLLPLYLKDDAKKEALRLQESRRVETDEDAKLGMIEAWLETPVRKPIAVDGEDPRADFDPLNDDGTEAPSEMVKRDQICFLDVFVDCLGGTRETYKRHESVMVGNAFKRISGWTEGGRIRVPRWGLQRVYVRAGSPADKKAQTHS